MADKFFEDEEMDIIILTDEDGVESRFEVVSVKEHEGKTYYALIALDEDEDDDSEAVDLVILKSETTPEGEEILVTIDDNEEFYDIADLFEDLQFDEIDYDDEDEDEGDEGDGGEDEEDE